ncbi:F-box protein PP2-A13 [Linum perenne]
MGARFSEFMYVAPVADSAGGGISGTSLGDIPESCAAEILMYLDAPGICSLARLNRSFRGASSADFVWETKLPSNYGFLVEKVLGVERSENLCRKEIYSRLCAPNCFGDGNKMAWLEKSSGKNCVTISYKAMRITGIDDRRYWTHIPADESRFKQVAYLQQTWWLEVVGELDDFQFPVGTYSLFFKLHLGKPTSAKPCRSGRHVSSDKVHGWDKKPIDCTHTKGGLCFDSVIVCPTEVRDRVVKWV